MFAVARRLGRSPGGKLSDADLVHLHATAPTSVFDSKECRRMSILSLSHLRPKRVDLHCHSRASTEADEAVLLALQCPESYSEPSEIYAQAKSRGMDFVTITDHDSIAGVTELAASDVI